MRWVFCASALGVVLPAILYLREQFGAVPMTCEVLGGDDEERWGKGQACRGGGPECI